MVKFSETLEEDENKGLSELDNLLEQKEVISIRDEEGLTNFLKGLDEKWAPHRENLEIFLRNRNIIPYTNMDPIKAVMCYVAIKDILRVSDVRKLEKYFQGKYVNIILICEGLHFAWLQNPDKSIFIASLLNYLKENTLFEPEETPAPIP